MADDIIVPPHDLGQNNKSRGAKDYSKGIEKKKELLGMPFGTAMARLRKAILFDLVVAAGKNVCHHCKGEILIIDEFSIEHKDPWQRAEDPVTSFFSLENIGYSHYRCNVGAAYKPHRKHVDRKEHSRVNFSNYYRRHGKRWNENRNARRRAATAAKRAAQHQIIGD